MSRLFTVPVQGTDSDERFTPRWIFDGLGLEFDLDPASPIEGGDCVPARHKLTRLEVGLGQPWEGRVWLNLPFSESTAWAARFRDHGHGVFLGPVANGKWWVDLGRHADLVWHCRDFAFTHPTHAGKRSSMPLCMMAMGRDCAAALERLATSGRHDGLLLAAPPPPTETGEP